jgi:hypothetical protein
MHVVEVIGGAGQVVVAFVAGEGHDEVAVAGGGGGQDLAVGVVLAALAGDASGVGVEPRGAQVVQVGEAEAVRPGLPALVLKG